MALTGKPHILALTHSDLTEGCTFARLITPLSALAQDGKVEYDLVRITPTNPLKVLRILHDLSRWDVVWIQRPDHYYMLLLMREARNRGKPVFIDLDDWLLDLPAEHIDARLYRSRQRQEIIRTALRAAHAISVSTATIAERCRELGMYAHLLPNAIDCTQFTRKPRDDDTLTIAFCGTKTHRDDVPLVAPALRKLLGKHPEWLRVVAVGCPIPELERMPGYTYHDLVPGTEYPRLLSELRVDIGLAPLHDLPFNRSKSDIKYLEYSATGAATIASPVAPYQASIREDRGVVVRENTTQAWDTAITRLVDDAKLRRRLAGNAYAWVQAHRSIEATASAWYDLFHIYSDGRLRTAPGARMTPRISAVHLDHMLVTSALRQIPSDTSHLSKRALQRARRKADELLSRG